MDTKETELRSKEALHIADVSASGITLTWDKEIDYKPTEDFIHAIGNLMLAEIRMNREVHKDYADCWVVGCCKIGDMANARHLEFVYGGLEDEEWIKSHGEIFVKLPL